eukprot:363634-Chlamydomonas_euryale.AAC.15
MRGTRPAHNAVQTCGTQTGPNVQHTMHMHACMHVCAHASKTDLAEGTSSSMHACMHANGCVQTHVCIHVCACMRVDEQKCARACMRAGACVRTISGPGSLRHEPRADDIEREAHRCGGDARRCTRQEARRIAVLLQHVHEILVVHVERKKVEGLCVRCGIGGPGATVGMRLGLEGMAQVVVGDGGLKVGACEAALARHMQHWRGTRGIGAGHGALTRHMRHWRGTCGIGAAHAACVLCTRC